MFIQERVDALKSEVDQLTEQLREKSKFAASEDVEGRGDPIQAARQMLELKEILKLKKLAFIQCCPEEYFERERSGGGHAAGIGGAISSMFAKITPERSPLDTERLNMWV